MLLEVKNIFKSFEGKDKPAINGISLRVKEQEFVSILGESGCGKSTLLRLINGLDDVDQGVITINGERVKGPKDVLVPGHPAVEKVDQDYDTFPNHTVIETLEYKLRQYEERYVKKRINHLLRLCKLQDHKTAIPRLMSGGEQQRVALAAALATSPDILLMDEPFSHLDPALRRKLKHEIKEIVQSEEVAVIFVTHDAQDALALSDKIIVMRKGKIIQTGEPEKLYHSPKTKYTAEFFGPINELHDSFSSKKYLRPEDLILCESENKDISGVVNQSEFLGYHYLISATSSKNEFIQFYTTNPIKKDTEIYLKVAEPA